MRTRFTVVIAMLVVVVGAAVYSLLGPHSANEVRQHESGSEAGDALEPSLKHDATESPEGNNHLVESPYEMLAPVPPASEGDQQPEGTHPERQLGTVGEGEEQFRFLGWGITMDQIRAKENERRIAEGLPPREPPAHRRHLQRFYALLEDHGFAREELFGPYNEMMIRKLVFLEPGFPSTPRTLEMAELCDASNWEAIHELIERRLDEDTYDIPALLMRFRLHTIGVNVNEMFVDAELLVPALTRIEPKGFDKRGILYDVMDELETYVYAGDNWLELQRERVDDRMETGGRVLVAHTLVYLHLLEIEDLW